MRARGGGGFQAIFQVKRQLDASAARPSPALCWLGLGLGLRPALGPGEAVVIAASVAARRRRERRAGLPSEPPGPSGQPPRVPRV